MPARALVEHREFPNLLSLARMLVLRDAGIHQKAKGCCCCYTRGCSLPAVVCCNPSPYFAFCFFSAIFVSSGGRAGPFCLFFACPAVPDCSPLLRRRPASRGGALSAASQSLPLHILLCRRGTEREGGGKASVVILPIDPTRSLGVLTERERRTHLLPSGTKRVPHSWAGVVCMCVLLAVASCNC